MKSAEKALRFYQHLINVHDDESRRYTKARLELKIDQSLRDLKKCREWIHNSQRGKVPVWIDELQHTVVDLKLQIDSLDKPFRLFVIGTGKAGKSSVLNALVGQAVAEVDFVAKTWKIDVFYGSDDKKVIIKYADGTSKTCDEKEAKDIVEKEEEHANSAIKQIKQEYRKIRRDKTLMGDAEREAEVAIKRKYGYQTQIIEAQWPVAGSSILRYFTLVDTPGINQELAHRNVKNTEKEYFEKANGILWIIPEDMIANKKAYEAITEMEKSYNRKFENSIAVINKMDLARKQDPVHGEEKILQEAKHLYGKQFRKIVSFEAELAYQSVCSHNEKGMLDSGLIALQQAIREEFFLTAREKQLEDIRDRIQSVKTDIGHRTNAIIQELDEAHKTYIDKYEACENAFQGAEEDSIKKMKSIFERTLKRIQRNAARYEDKIDSLKGEERKNFINEEVLEYDILVQDFEKFRMNLRTSLSLLLKFYKTKMIFVEYENLFALMQRKEDDRYEDIDIMAELGLDDETFSTTGGQVILSGALGIGAAMLLGPVGLAAAIIGATSVGHIVVRFLKKITGNGIVDQITKAYKEQFDKEQIKLEESIHLNYSEAMKMLTDLEDRTFAEVYMRVSELSDFKDRLNRFSQSVSGITVENMPLFILLKGVNRI